MRSLVDIRTDVQRAVNDDSATYWTPAEIDAYLVQAYKELARTSRGLWDLRYAESLPPGFSYTQPWELPYAQALGFDYGCANYTYDDERRLLEETNRIGPGSHTSPGDLPWLTAAGATQPIPATATIPDTVTDLDRPTWDDLTIPVMAPTEAMARDPRYEVTQGETYALVTTGQGIRTIRKVRVPAASADTYSVYTSWGICRSIADVSADTSVTGTWGVPRRIPGQHPMGSEHSGLPRRFYRDGKNVRLEHWREGRALDTGAAVWELPDRAAVYARDYALSRCYGRSGPAQDLTLAKHYAQRYARGAARLQRRVSAVHRQRVGMLGSVTTTRRAGPPRPRLPWNYGSTVRR